MASLSTNPQKTIRFPRLAPTAAKLWARLTPVFAARSAAEVQAAQARTAAARAKVDRLWHRAH